MLQVEDVQVALEGASGAVTLRCYHCGESATVAREFAAVVESWFRDEHRCTPWRG